MSAFIRRQPGAAGARAPIDLGTRPGLHGQVLISTGLAGLDRLLGGGLPLGTILLLLEDSNSQQHLNILKCFMAEGVCCKHSIAWVTSQQLTPESTGAFLPDQARSGSASTGSGGQVGTMGRAPDVRLHTLQLLPRACAMVSGLTSTSVVQATQFHSSSGVGSGSSAAAGGAPEDGLKIAWQYRKYIQQQQRAEVDGPDRSRASTAR